MKKFLGFLLALVSFSATAQHNYLLVGTYTSGKSEGIYVYDFNSMNGNASPAGKIKSSNPSYLTVAPGGNYVYAVNEEGGGKGGRVSSYSFNKKNGKLHFINEQPSGGDDPCFIALDNTAKWAAVANYSGGSLSIFPVNKNGSLSRVSTHIQHNGNSINKDRQEKAHVHSTFFSKDNKYLFVQDLGMDEITVYPFNEKTGKLSQQKKYVIKSTPGSGPRHIDFSTDNKYVYALHELNGRVSVYKNKNGKLQLVQDIDAAENNFKGFMGSADIHVSPDGNFLYCSNRGDANDITIFRINKNDGKLFLTGFQSTLGRGPRNFNFDPSGNFLLTANQNSDDIIIFKINKKTGLLTDTGKKIDIGNPVCLKWIGK